MKDLIIHIVVVRGFSDDWQNIVKKYEKTFRSQAVHKHIISDEQFIPVVCSLIIDSYSVDAIVVISGKYNQVIHQELLRIASEELVAIDYRYDEIHNKTSKLLESMQTIMQIYDDTIMNDEEYDLFGDYDEEYIQPEEEAPLISKKKNKKNNIN
ncbi:MAG: hypothetical protein KBS95_04195 [Alistipes sp.]|nr:hypothetical protein [Candidatus Alistipes equi]